MSFFWGQTPSLTPDGARRRRELADAFLANMGKPKDLGEGLASIGNALAVRGLNKQADEAERTGKEKASKLFSDLIAGNKPQPYSTDGGPMTVLGVPPRTPEQEIGDDAMAALGKTDAMSDVGQIRQGMIDRGLPEHVADAFIMNFRDESGLNPGINEIAPIVPGSRGGFGLAQWTGPRRVALEEFAKKTGRPVDDVNVQLDFLMSELNGSEAGAAKHILSARNAPEAATEIVNRFLRPAEEHRARRVAQYSGGAQNAPQNAPQVDNSQLYAALANPWMDQTQRAAIMQMIQRNEAMADPMNQMRLEKAQLELEKMRQPAAGFTILTDEEEAKLGLDTKGAYQRDPNGKVSQIGGGGTNITLKSEGTIPQGYRALRDENGNLLGYEPVPGGPEDTSDQDAKKAEQTETAANIVMDEIGIAKELIAGETLLSPATGITGGLLSGVDSSRAGALKNRLETIKANIGFDKLQRMREASPTGGALGAVSEFENRLLQSVFGSLEQAQNAEDLLYNLDRLQALYDRVINEGIPDDEARELYKQFELGEDLTETSDEDLFKKYGLD